MAVGIARSRIMDLHLAEDAAQEAFAVACQQLHSLHDGARFPAWIATICRRTARRMERAHSNDVPLEIEPAAPTDGEASSDAAQLISALQRLPPSARECIQLHYFSGLSYEEIGRTLGVSPQAVHGRLQRARRQLARQLSLPDE